MTAGSASAGTLSFSFETLFNGTSPGGTNGSVAPYATAVFTDVDANTVSLTLTSSLENSAHYISDIALNFNPLKSVTGLTIAQASGSGTLTNPTTSSIVKDENNVTLTGSGTAGRGFDIQFNWAGSGGPNGTARFNNTDTNIFTITSASGLSVQDFNYKTTNNYYGAVRVAGIGSNLSGALASGIPTLDVGVVVPPSAAAPEPLTI